MLRGGCFCGWIRYETGPHPLMRRTAIARSAGESPGLRSSRGSACLGLSFGSFAASRPGLSRPRRARGVFVLGVARS